jgi:hypothetical protein
MPKNSSEESIQGYINILKEEDAYSLSRLLPALLLEQFTQVQLYS